LSWRSIALIVLVQSLLIASFAGLNNRSYSGDLLRAAADDSIDAHRGACSAVGA
jgi:hypothetical protein